MKKRYVLLNPGPVNIKEKVREALLVADTCHREPEFSKLLLDCKRKLLKAFSIEARYDAVFFTGSGTAALEAAVISSAPEGRKILVVNNGVYGERILEIAKRHSIPALNLKFDITVRPDISLIEERLKEDKHIAVVAMVHHETSTGLLNPVNEIGALCDRYGRIYLLDSISALGGEELDFNKTKVGLCVGTANKCIESVPGISFVLVKKGLIRRLEGVKSRSLYLDLLSNLKAQSGGDPLFTPAIQTFSALDAALDDLIREGVRARIRRYGELAELFRKCFKECGIENLIAPEYQSNTITALRLPRGVSYRRLHGALKKDGFIIYSGQSKLKDVIFRVANMGQISKADARRFLKSLKIIIGNKSEPFL